MDKENLFTRTINVLLLSIALRKYNTSKEIWRCNLGPISTVGISNICFNQGGNKILLSNWVNVESFIFCYWANVWNHSYFESEKYFTETIKILLFIIMLVKYCSSKESKYFVSIRYFLIAINLPLSKEVSCLRSIVLKVV